jgi:hypothetical protein
MSPLHDRPDPEDLVATVRRLLADEVIGGLEGRARFNLRVALNVLDIVARQLASEGDDEAAHRQRLDRVGFADDAALAAAIRSGELDDRYAEVAEAIRADVWAKVGVVNPRYREPYQSPDTARETLPTPPSL